MFRKSIVAVGFGCSVGFAAAASPVAADSITLQHAAMINLGPSFFAENPEAGTPVSPYGANPISVTFDGTHAYIGGWNNTLVTNSVGVVQVQNVLSAAPTLNELPGTVFSADGFRGIIGIGHHDGAIYTGYDGSSAATSHITRYDTAGNLVWRTMDPGNGVAFGDNTRRVFALAVDPMPGSAGGAEVAFLGFGHGRRASVLASDGSRNYTFSNDANPGGILTGHPENYGWGFRALDFDSEGNIALSADKGFQYGLRSAVNQWTALDATPDRTAGSVGKLPQGEGVGQGIAILEGLADDNLLAFSGRASTPGSFSLTLTDMEGNMQAADSRHVHIRNVNGTTTGLAQTTLTGDEDGIGWAWTNEAKNLAFGQDANGLPVLLVVSFIERRLDVYTLEPTWTADEDGTWSNSDNWLAGAIPDSTLTNARFGGSISEARSVTVDSGRTVKVLKFDSEHAYTLDGPGTITLDSAGTPQIQVHDGSHTIAAPLSMVRTTHVSVAAGSSLTASGDISTVSGMTLVKAGEGTLAINTLTGPNLLIGAGMVRLLADSNASTVQTLSIARDESENPLARLDITNTSILVQDADVADVASLVSAGYSVGNWDGHGIISSSAQGTPGRAVGFIPEVGDEVLVGFTFAGDANLDGRVTIADLSLLATNWQRGVDDGQTAYWFHGDFNYDGRVTIADLSILASNWQAGVAAGEATMSFAEALAMFEVFNGVVIPEPGALSLLGVAGLLALRRRNGARAAG